MYVMSVEWILGLSQIWESIFTLTWTGGRGGRGGGNTKKAQSQFDLDFVHCVLSLMGTMRDFTVPKQQFFMVLCVSHPCSRLTLCKQLFSFRCQNGAGLSELYSASAVYTQVQRTRKPQQWREHATYLYVCFVYMFHQAIIFLLALL